MDREEITNEILHQYQDALRLKNQNQELYNQLCGSIYYIIKYSQKNNITLPNKEALLNMIEKAGFLIDQFAHQPIVNTNNDQPDSEQNHFLGAVTSRLF